MTEVAEKGLAPLEQFVNPETLKVDVEINLTNLDDAMMTTASMFVHYSNLARKARQQHDREKVTNELLESRLDSEHRLRLKEEGAKVTEAQISSAVKNDPRWWTMQKRLIEARGQYDLANTASEAFSMRRDMLIQIATDRREERKGELRITESQEKTRVLNMLQQKKA